MTMLTNGDYDIGDEDNHENDDDYDDDDGVNDNGIPLYYGNKETFCIH